MLSAGGIFALELDGSRLGPGDITDRKMFGETCHNAGLTDASSIESVWKAGQDVVRKRLQDPIFRNGMLELARRMKTELEEQQAF